MSSFTTRYLADYTTSDFLINQVHLIVELDSTRTKVESRLSIKKQNLQASTLILDGEQLVLLSVSMDNKTLTKDDYLVDANTLTIHSVPDECELVIVTEIDPENNTALEGLFKSGDAFCTQCEAEGFRRITYYLDRPDVMATFTTQVIADKQQYPYLLANGNIVDKGDLGNGRHFVTWYDPFPKPCYLFALVAGNFDVLIDEYITTSGRKVALEIFVDQGNLNRAHHAMASLKHSMKWDEDTFGLEYDLDIYMIVAVDFFNMGAMENKGLNVFNSKYVLADKESATDTDYFNIEAVIAHEYFHNWTGNRVTCRDWFQLSLKEGLTVFRDQQFSADMHSAGVTRIQNVKVLRAQQFAEDAGPMSHPIRPEKVMEMNNFYTLTVYEKGAEVIRMLHTLLGAKGFRKGMDLYFKRFDGMAVTCDDFVNAMADANHEDLSLFKHWYSQSGTPTLTVTRDYDQINKRFSLTLSQHNLKAVEQGRDEILHIPVGIELISADGQQHQTHLVSLKESRQTWHFDIDYQPNVAFLTGFTAPVKVTFKQPIDELVAIINYGHDSFCRWDAMQKIMSHTIKQLMKEIDYQVPKDIIHIFEHCLTTSDDNAFKALMLTMPAFDELVSDIEQVDPQKLYQAMHTFKQCIAENLLSAFHNVYQSCINNLTVQSAEATANRALQNVCLAYIVMVEGNERLVEQQYEQSCEMTTMLGALECAARINSTRLKSMLSSYEKQWHNNTLVMDKWFSIHAKLNSNNIFEQLHELMQRDDFSLKNPNRARSLIGIFAMQNPQYFHEKTGKGYQFLTDQIIALDLINPQVASRLITPLIQFESFSKPYQQLMKDELKRIKAQPKLSRDLVEKLDAALYEE